MKAGLVYSLVMFSAGFELPFVRLPFLVPRFGIRAAELLETPVMLVVIDASASERATLYAVLRTLRT